MFGSINFYHASRPLSSLDWVRELVSGSTIRRAGERTKPPVVLFRLCSNATDFGILQGNNKSGAETLVARIQPGGSLTVYYDADGAEADGVSMHIYQAEKLLQMLYSIQEKQAGEKAVAFVGLLFGVGFAL